MKRSLLPLGSLLSIAGAVGLIAFGDALVGIIDGALTYRFVDPPDPVPAAFVKVKLAAFSGVVLTLGLAASCFGTFLNDERQALTPVGRTCIGAAGILLVLGMMPLMWGLLGAKRALTVIATSAATPNPVEVHEMVQATAPTLLIGSAILLIGAVALLVAGQIGIRPGPPQNSSTRSVSGGGFIVPVGAVVLGIVVSLLFVGAWLHGNALGEIFAATSNAPKPTEIAGHLMGILNKSMLAFIGVGCLGIASIFAAISASTAESDAPPTGRPVTQTPRERVGDV